MKSTKRVPSVLLHAVIPLFASWAIASADLASAATTVTDGLPVESILYLDLGASDQFRWVKPDTPVALESVTDPTKCKLTLGADPARNAQLVTVTGGGGSAGFNGQKDWIGVAEQSKGIDCGRTGPGQSVTLALTGQLAGKAVAYTKLQINAKKNVVVKAVLWLKGTAGQTFFFRSGLSATGTPGPNETFCNPGVTDSSPDSRANCAWNFNGLWDQVKFSTDTTLSTAAVGEWSLAGPASSEFDLVKYDGVLACANTNTTITAGNGVNSATVGGVRYANSDGSSCIPIPYTLSSSCNQAGSCSTDFRYDPLGQGDKVAFAFQWTWPIETIPGGGVNWIPLSQQFFSNGAGPIPLDFCAGTVAVYQSGQLTGLNGAVADQDGDNTNGVQAGCLTKRQVQQNGTGAVLTEEAWVKGDYGVQRN